MYAVVDQLPRLGKRELICLLLFTCNYVVSVWGGFLFLWVLGMGYFILLWHSQSLPYYYSAIKPMLRSTCPNQLILLVRSTIVFLAPGAKLLRERSLITSSFALTLQIRHNAEVGLVKPLSRPKSVLHFPRLLNTLVRTSTLRLMGSGSSWQNFPREHSKCVTSASSQPPPAESMSPR